MSKLKITKLDILRWFAVLPVSVIVLMLFDIFSGWLNKFYLLDLHGNPDSTFLTYINCFAVPAIILISGYVISPKFKFISTLILSFFYIVITIYALVTETYLHRGLSPFILIFIGTYLVGLYVIYKLDNKKI